MTDPTPRLNRIRAVGGHLTHAVPLDAGEFGAALCGYKPGQTKAHLRVHRTTRAGWTRQVGLRDCPDCMKRLELAP